MIMRPVYVLVAYLLLIVAAEPSMSELEGTWVSKSNTVFTGPGFYDPVDELLIEPDLPGISYSFTKDGHYEEALYRVTSDPSNHSCAVATLQYQHGKYEILSNGSVVLTPLKVDGRQLLSDPCGSTGVSNKNPNNSIYSRYVQPTYFKTYQVSVDAYHGRYKLQIYQFDGSKMQPLYLAYKPPLMLPTYALNPTDKSSETKTASLRKRVKRSLENSYRTTAVREFDTSKYDLYWYLSVSLLAGASAFAFFH